VALNTPFDRVWSLTPRDLIWGQRVLVPKGPDRLSRADLNDLMAAHPDGTRPQIDNEDRHG
jgi:hypothetical protein